MTTTITSTRGGVFTPALVLDYATDRESRNVKHDILDRADFDFTLRPDAPRSGTLNLFFTDEASAFACEDGHSRSAVFTLTDTTIPSANMKYVRDGRLSRNIEEGTTRWVVQIGYQEVISSASVTVPALYPSDGMYPSGG